MTQPTGLHKKTWDRRLGQAPRQGRYRNEAHRTANQERTKRQQARATTVANKGMDLGPGQGWAESHGAFSSNMPVGRNKSG